MNSRIGLGIIISFLFLLCSCSIKNKHDDEESHLCLFSLPGERQGGPVGFFYHEGEYHLFLKPAITDGPEKGTLQYLTSPDFLHWRRKTGAGSPDNSRRTGSILVDPNNVSGLGTAETPPFIAFYTKGDTAGNDIGLVYSPDRGNTWINLEESVLTGNKNMIFKNPRVSFNDLMQQWLMTVSTGSSVRFYYSSDFLQWFYLSEFNKALPEEGDWESADLISVPVAESDQSQSLLMVNTEERPFVHYFTGRFNGTEFIREQSQELWADYGSGHFTATVLNDPTAARRLMLGWLSRSDQVSGKDDGCLLFPRELELVPEKNYFLLTSSPLRELSSHYVDTDSIGELKLSGTKSIFKSSLSQKPFKLNLKFNNTERYAFWGSRNYGIRVNTRSGRILSIGYRAELNQYYIDDSDLTGKAELSSGAIYSFSQPTIDWTILFNKGSVEFFACGNRIVMSASGLAGEAFERVELFAENGSITLLKASLAELTK